MKPWKMRKKNILETKPKLTAIFVIQGTWKPVKNKLLCQKAFWLTNTPLNIKIKSEFLKLEKNLKLIIPLQSKAEGSQKILKGSIVKWYQNLEWKEKVLFSNNLQIKRASMIEIIWLFLKMRSPSICPFMKKKMISHKKLMKQKWCKKLLEKKLLL